MALAALRDGKAGDALAAHARLVVATSATPSSADGRARRTRARPRAGAARAGAPASYGTGTPSYPIGDEVPDRPAVLLGRRRRRRDVLDRPRVAIVGTRSASLHGLADARELGGFLARRGITVVSGLAIGIDGAAHQGRSTPAAAWSGVVATGLDVVYPAPPRRALRPRARAGVLV